jgi:peptidoglycan/xylan/chitin deacetylase (PgdA/CDA1 family)
MIPQNLLIINYHKIEPKTDLGITTRHPDTFRCDLQEIENLGYQTINFYDLLSPAKLPDKPVIITFDDAYLSFYEVAFAMLKERKMKAVVFVPVDYIGQSNNWDVQFFNKKYKHMSRDQLKEISENSIEVGSHTLSHTYLNGLTDFELEKELRSSKQKLEKITDKPVLSISYPFGKYNKRVIEATAKYYKYGVQLLPFFIKQKSSHKLLLKRINIYRVDSRKDFRRKMDYQNYPGLLFKNWLIQQGAWATILLNKVVGK